MYKISYSIVILFHILVIYLIYCMVVSFMWPEETVTINGTQYEKVCDIASYDLSNDMFVIGRCGRYYLLYKNNNNMLTKYECNSYHTIVVKTDEYKPCLAKYNWTDDCLVVPTNTVFVDYY